MERNNKRREEESKSKSSERRVEWTTGDEIRKGTRYERNLQSQINLIYSITSIILIITTTINSNKNSIIMIIIKQ